MELCHLRFLKLLIQLQSAVLYVALFVPVFVVGGVSLFSFLCLAVCYLDIFKHLFWFMYSAFSVYLCIDFQWLPYCIIHMYLSRSTAINILPFQVTCRKLTCLCVPFPLPLIIILNIFSTYIETFNNAIIFASTIKCNLETFREGVHFIYPQFCSFHCAFFLTSQDSSIIIFFP